MHIDATSPADPEFAADQFSEPALEEVEPPSSRFAKNRAVTCARLPRDTQIERRAVVLPGAGASCAFARPSAHASTILDRNTNA
ncbi:hypothetical protein ACIQRW_21755 [Streptomyces sp. NPDC091287]|uniref:hypothetical protein n=1 Tax=Streptomyces sp. NPDC091287 TaxID=3365988 RepID=UPI0038281AFE